MSKRKQPRTDHHRNRRALSAGWISAWKMVERLLNEIRMHAMDRIDAEIARQFLNNPDSVDLSKYKHLNDDAAGNSFAVYRKS